MDSVGLHLVEWPFYPLYVFSYSLIIPICQQKKLYRVRSINAYRFDTGLVFISNVVI